MYNSIYPVQIKPYVPPQNKKAVTSGSAEEEQQNPTATDPHERNKRDSYERQSRQEFPNGQKTTIDYSKSQVNIAQILTDFKNTASAIGSPPNIIQEVDQYLSLAEAQSFKSEPNKKIIQSNLKNASNVLDDFISKTLNKKSKVVENWIEALFLQQVNYKSDPETINPDFLVKLPDSEGDMKPISKDLSEKSDQQIQDKATAAAAEQAVTNPAPEPKSSVYVPENQDLKKAFLQGKKFASINQPEKALDAFEKALEQAQSIGDTRTEGMLCYEIGKIYDKSDNLEDALKFYNLAHKSTPDNNIKAKAYYSMAQIYDDVVYFEPAMEHYFAAISCAGEAENLNAQSKSLSEIAGMYAERYDKESTHEYLGVAKNIALETKNNKTIASIWSQSGDSLALINENADALKDYKTSSQFYEKADSPQKMARNYEKAAEIMVRLGNTDKAQSLLKKARQISEKA